MRFAVILVVSSLPALVSCSASPQPVPQENRIVNADRWYVPEHEVPRCGARIQAEDVQVVDLESLDYGAAALERQLGPFQQVTDRPVAVSGMGSNEEIEQRVRQMAAGKGCDVVLLGPVHTQTEYPGGSGMNPGGKMSKEEVPYQLFRMGYRTD